MNAGLIDQRAAIDFCRREGELLTLSKEIQPAYEIAAVSKRFEGGPVLVFENIGGYPNWRAVTNLFSRRDRIAKYFGTTREGLSKRILEAVQKPIPPKLVTQAPCQENIVTA